MGTKFGDERYPWPIPQSTNTSVQSNQLVQKYT